MPKGAKKVKDPEGRMPLTEHLRELRNRLGISVASVLAVTIVAMFFAKDIMDFLTDQVPRCDPEEAANGTARNCALLQQHGLTAPFATYFRVSLLAGLIAASPIWLYQAWAFIAPGLHRNEKKYTRAVVSVGVPLFCAGVYFAYWLLPRATRMLLSFAADDATNVVTVEQVLDITIRLALAFGLSFELPLVLVLLNFGGVVSGRRMLSWWRWMVVGIAVFAAAITPTDLMSMVALQVPVTALYFIACGIAVLHDYRKGRGARREPELSDDEAAPLDLTPEEIEPPERVGSSSHEEGGQRLNGFDDAT